MKEGGPGISGKGCVVSKDAKERTRLRIRDDWEMRWSFMKVSNSGGSGGRGLTSLNLAPLGPQQKPDVSPVNKRTPHV
jgi:hypothetical protein